MRSFVSFLTVFLSLYGLLHAYAYTAIRRSVALKRPWGTVLILLFAGLLFAPILGRVLASRGMTGLSGPVLLAGYEWMAAIFLFVAAQAFLDGVRLLLFLLRRTVPRMQRLPTPGKKAFFTITCLALTAFAYGHFEARHLRVERMDLASSKLAPGDRLRVVQVSDLHFSSVNGTLMARRVADRIRAMEPDLIVATGDLVDRGMKDAVGVARILRGLEAPLGKYAVTGNHEFYHGLGHALGFMKRAGFRVLRGEAVHPGPRLTVVGIDDEAAYRFSGPEGESAASLLRRAPKGDFLILLRHRPRIDPGTEGRFDLQLSGHTHGGQIFPFGWIVSLVFPYLKGTHELEGGSVLHVNRGTGTWGPPVRFLSPPEITVIDCRPR